MTGPLTMPSFSLTSSIVPHAALVLRALLREDETAVLVLLLEHKRLELVVERDDLVRIDVVADRELAGRDHALGLETDVEQHLVAVDLDHATSDDVSVVELDDGGVDRVGERLPAEVVEHHESVGLGPALSDLVGLVGLFGVRCARAGFRGRHCRRVRAVVGDGSLRGRRHVLL